MANLILWRQAEAEATSTSSEDIDRALTKKGRKDAAKMAKWLSRHLPDDAKILCSPARRCLETVAALQRISENTIQIVEFLGVDSSAEIIAKKVMNDDNSKTTLIIGHQPNLGLLIAKLLGMPESACVVKKGAVWWLRQRLANDVSGVTPQMYLFTVQHPDY